MPIMVACSNHLGEVVDMDSGRYKAAGEEIQAVKHGHCSMALATLDMQVGHTRGSLKLAALPEGAADRECQM